MKPNPRKRFGRDHFHRVRRARSCERAHRQRHVAGHGKGGNELRLGVESVKGADADARDTRDRLRGRSGKDTNHWKPDLELRKRKHSKGKLRLEPPAEGSLIVPLDTECRQLKLQLVSGGRCGVLCTNGTSTVEVVVTALPVCRARLRYDTQAEDRARDDMLRDATNAYCTVIVPRMPIARCGVQKYLYVPAGTPANEIV